MREEERGKNIQLTQILKTRRINKVFKKNLIKKMLQRIKILI